MWRIVYLMKSIKISVIVPIYNVKEYIGKCIESIINQIYENLEIILVDDGSKDGSSDICDYYAKIDDRIDVIHKNNGGVVSARKAGTEIATGDYILYVDGDDWIEKDRIDVLVKDGILSSGADMIYLSGHKRDFGEDSVFISDDFSNGTFYNSDIESQVVPLLFDNKSAFKSKIKTSPWMWAIQSDLLKRKQSIVDDRIVIGEDTICIWFCLLDAKSVSIIQQGGYHYVQRKSSIVYSASYNMNNLSMGIWYRQLKQYIKEYTFSQIVDRTFIFASIFELIVSNYDLLLKKSKDYLYPFPKVKCGQKIIVYGAGRTGYALMNFLSATDDYKVILWVDKQLDRPAVPGWTISPIENIDKADYDCIVIAILNANITDEVKDILIRRGISEEKIAVMDPSVITEDAIPDEILK